MKFFTVFNGPEKWGDKFSPHCFFRPTLCMFAHRDRLTFVVLNTHTHTHTHAHTHTHTLSLSHTFFESIRFSSGIKRRESERRAQEELARKESAQQQLCDFDKMSVAELKNLIKELTGTKPRFTSKPQLIDIVRAHRAVPPEPDDGLRK